MSLLANTYVNSKLSTRLPSLLLILDGSVTVDHAYNSFLTGSIFTRTKSQYIY